MLSKQKWKRYCKTLGTSIERGGQWTVYYTSPPKFYDNVFLLAGLTTLGTFIVFWMVRLLSIAVVKPTNQNWKFSKIPQSC